MMNLSRLSNTSLDLATFYESISKLCNYDNTSFNSVHKAIFNFNTDKISVDLNFLDQYTPIVLQEQPTTTILQTQTGILNSITDISCSAKLVDTHITLLQNTDQIIASETITELLNKVIIHDIAILDEYILDTPELTEDNTINISFNTYDTATETFPFGTRACSILLPIIPHSTITLTNKNINNIFSPANGTVDFDGTGNITNYFGIHTLTFNAVTSTCTEKIFLDNAQNATINKLLPQNITGNDQALCFDTVMIPAVNQWATTPKITPDMFWSSDINATIHLDLVDVNDSTSKVNARGFHLTSDINTEHLEVIINRTLLDNPAVVLHSINPIYAETPPWSHGSLMHQMTTAGSNNTGILSFSQLYSTAKSIEEIGNNNRTSYIADISYELKYDNTPEFSLNSFNIDTNPNPHFPEDRWLTVRLPETSDNLFSAFTLSDLTYLSPTQNYEITVNTPLLYSNIINYTKVDSELTISTCSTFSCDIVLGDDGFTLANFATADDISLTPETITKIQSQLFDIKLNNTSIANDSNIKNIDGCFKMFNSCHFHMDHYQTALQGLLFQSGIDSSDYSNAYSGASHPHGYAFSSPEIEVSSLAYSSEKTFGMFNCYVDSTNSTELPIVIKIPYTTYITFNASSSNTSYPNGYWSVQQEASTQITLQLKRHSNIYQDMEGETILALDITLEDPGIIGWGDRTVVPPGEMYSEVKVGNDYKGTPHDIYLNGNLYTNYNLSDFCTQNEDGGNEITPNSAGSSYLTIVHYSDSLSASSYGGGTFKVTMDFKQDTVTLCSNNISRVSYTIYLDEYSSESGTIFRDTGNTFVISDIGLNNVSLGFSGYSLTN